MRVSHYWLAVTACGNCLQWRQDMNYLLCSGAVSGGQEASVRSHLGLKLIRGWFCRSYFQNWIILLLCVTLYYTLLHEEFIFCHAVICNDEVFKQLTLSVRLYVFQ